MLKIAVPQWGMGQAKAEQGLQSQDSRMNQYEFRRENLRGLCGLFTTIFTASGEQRVALKPRAS